jgi:hypothetical protein
MYCVDCGHPIARRFCRNCGAEQPSTLGGPGGSLEIQDEPGGSIEMQDESTTTMRSGGPPNTPLPGPAEVPELDTDCCGNYSRRSRPYSHILNPVRSQCVSAQQFRCVSCVCCDCILVLCRLLVEDRATRRCLTHWLAHAHTNRDWCSFRSSVVDSTTHCR